MKKIDHYQIIKTIATGGMGEVFLAYDPICKRNVALKRIKDEYKDNTIIKARFLKEAKIAGQLTHPSIIAIYSINNNPLYYTMTYVEGETLKQILNKIKEAEDANTPLENSLHACLRYFLSVCEAIAYTHSKNILHRDLKPDNIMIGKYGEVIILDWGISCFLDEVKKDNIDEFELFDEKADLTRPGKLAGTLCYMAPERATGASASVLTDIYALGAMLYQILTLSPPFKRHNIVEFKKLAPIEKPLDPIEKVPFRDIPLQLNEITKKCLSFDPKNRYQNVDELISDLKNYLEGKPDWILKAKLNITNHADWQFQENIFLAKYLAIDQTAEETEWVSIMYSKKRFSENIKLEVDVSLKPNSFGIGFLLCVPDESDRKNIEESYCIWINNHKVKLLRSNILLKETQHNVALTNEPIHFKIEKIDNTISCYINNIPILSHMSHLPLLGKHVGLAYKDDDFTLSEITIYSNTYNALVSCLAIPDAFFAKKKYDKALLEYREISSSFGGRTEGRQAVFRAGLTLINKTKKNKTILYEALDEFAKLHNTQSEPLEYLGKSLAYAALKEPQEELKCLELAARKFSRHPLFPMIEEHIIYRMHESALKDRATTYGLALIVLTQIKDAIKRNPDVAALVNSIRQNLPYLYFIKDTIIAIQLAFWLNKQTTLLELLSSNKDMAEQIIFALLELNHYDKVKQLNNPLTNIALLSHNTSISNGLEQFFLLSPTIPNSTQKYAMLFYLLDYALIKEDFVSLNYAINLAHLPLFESQSLDIIIIKKALLENDLTKAEEMFEKYPKELTQDTSNISFLYSCFNLLTTGKDSFITQNIALCFPNIASLGSIYLTDTKNPWLKHAFYFEKKELYKQLFIYYHCVKNQKRKKYFQHLIYQQNDE